MILTVIFATVLLCNAFWNIDRVSHVTMLLGSFCIILLFAFMAQAFVERKMLKYSDQLI